MSTPLGYFIDIRLSGTDDSQLEKQETLSRKIESTLSKAQTRGSLYTKEDCACLWAFAGFRLYYPDERNLLVEQSGNSRRWGSQQVCRYVSNMEFHTIMRGIGYEQSQEDWDPDMITAEDLDIKGHGGFTAVYLSKGVELDLGRNATWEEIMAESTHLDGRGIVIRQGTLMLGMYISGKSKKLSAFKAYMTEDRTCLRKMASVGDLKVFPTALFRDSSPIYAMGYIVSLSTLFQVLRGASCCVVMFQIPSIEDQYQYIHVAFPRCSHTRITHIRDLLTTLVHSLKYALEIKPRFQEEGGWKITGRLLKATEIHRLPLQKKRLILTVSSKHGWMAMLTQHSLIRERGARELLQQ
jgi:hypothetical protein